MKARKRLGVLLSVLCILAVVLGFTGCGDDDDGGGGDDGGGNLVGTWAGQYGDSFTVTGTTFSYIVTRFTNR